MNFKYEIIDAMSVTMILPNVLPIYDYLITECTYLPI